jgi:hypothetical protein
MLIGNSRRPTNIPIESVGLVPVLDEEEENSSGNNDNNNGCVNKYSGKGINVGDNNKAMEHNFMSNDFFTNLKDFSITPPSTRRNSCMLEGSTVVRDLFI